VNWSRRLGALGALVISPVGALASSLPAHGEQTIAPSEDQQSASQTPSSDAVGEPTSKPAERRDQHAHQHSHGSHGRDNADMPMQMSPSDQASPEGSADHSSDTEHVPPDPPQHPLRDMPYSHMAEMMQMDDRERFGKILIDQLEWRHTDAGASATWEAQGWYGGDYNKLFVKTEGERVAGSTEDARVDLLWDRIVSRWWSMQTGVRQDFGEGPSRTWAALGLQGIAPCWFDAEATLYVGEKGRTAARLKAEYDVLLTQRLILQPEIEANLYGKSDPARQVGSGLSDMDLGVRLRYEIRRELAPYVGISWRRRFGSSADMARVAGESASDVQLLAGIRLWL
jgi:copper resistance protein B